VQHTPNTSQGVRQFSEGNGDSHHLSRGNGGNGDSHHLFTPEVLVKTSRDFVNKISGVNLVWCNVYVQFLKDQPPGFNRYCSPAYFQIFETNEKPPTGGFSTALLARCTYSTFTCNKRIQKTYLSSLYIKTQFCQNSVVEKVD
jgi:hypothetical protein